MTRPVNHTGRSMDHLMYCEQTDAYFCLQIVNILPLTGGPLLSILNEHSYYREVPSGLTSIGNRHCITWLASFTDIVWSLVFLQFFFFGSAVKLLFHFGVHMNYDSREQTRTWLHISKHGNILHLWQLLHIMGIFHLKTYHMAS